MWSFVILTIMFARFFHVAYISTSFLFLAKQHSGVCLCTSCFSIRLLIIYFSLGYTVLLRTFTCRFCVDTFSILLRVYLEVKLVGQMVTF